MIIQMLNSAKKTVKYWWVSLLIGIIAFVLGIMCLVTPDKSLVALSYAFIAAFLFDGVLEIVFAISNRKTLMGWGWTLTTGILELLLGILLFTLPLPLVATTLIYLVGFWILFRSIMTIGESCQLQLMRVQGWGWLLAIGILSVLFSFLFLSSPLFGGISLIIFAGIALMSYGIFRIILAFRFRSFHNIIREVEDEDDFDSVITRF